SRSRLMCLVGLCYFLLSFLAIVALAMVHTAYGLMEARGCRHQTSAEIRRLTRTLFLMIAVMAPLLFFAAFIIKGVLSIIGWAIAYAAFSSVIMAKYIRDSRQSRATL